MTKFSLWKLKKWDKFKYLGWTIRKNELWKLFEIHFDFNQSQKISQWKIKLFHRKSHGRFYSFQFSEELYNILEDPHFTGTKRVLRTENNEKLLDCKSDGFLSALIEYDQYKIFCLCIKRFTKPIDTLFNFQPCLIYKYAQNV